MNFLQNYTFPRPKLKFFFLLLDFPRKLTLLGEGEQVNKATLLDYIKPRDYENKLKFVVSEESLISGDAKIPPRLANVPPPKRGEELAAELTEKMQKTTLRREQLINSIVEKSRTYVSALKIIFREAKSTDWLITVREKVTASKSSSLSKLLNLVRTESTFNNFQWSSRRRLTIHIKRNIRLKLS